MLNRLSIFFPRFEARTLPGDVLGGVTAAVVALAFGIAAGLGPAAGVYGAISVGFFTAVPSRREVREIFRAPPATDSPACDIMCQVSLPPDLPPAPG